MNKSFTILLVEDDQTACKQFVEYVDRLENISLIGVTNNSTKALEYIKSYLPDAIILDLELHGGGGNGLFLLNELKQLTLPVFPYILVTTNNSSPITYESARKLGTDFIMSKHQSDYSVKNVIEFIRILIPDISNQKKSIDAKSPITESPANKSKKLTLRISSELNLIGISPKAVGYQYLIEAIKLIIDNPQHNLCSTIGKTYGKTDASVERAMQNAVNKAWRTSDIDTLLRYYTARISSEKGVPTATEFVYYYANKIKLEL